MKSDAQFEFEKRMAELFFPNKIVSSMSINLSVDRDPEVQATFLLDELMQDSLMEELAKYNLELTPKDKE